jgi:hypothetical protein
MSVVWLCAQGEGERAGSADYAAQTSDDAGGAQCHTLDGAGNGVGTRSEKGVASLWAYHHC